MATFEGSSVRKRKKKLHFSSRQDLQAFFVLVVVLFCVLFFTFVSKKVVFVDSTVWIGCPYKMS